MTAIDIFIKIFHWRLAKNSKDIEHAHIKVFLVFHHFKN